MIAQAERQLVMETWTGIADSIAWGESEPTCRVEQPCLPGWDAPSDGIHKLLLLRALQPDHRKWSSQVATREGRDLARDHMLYKSNGLLSALDR